MERIEEAVRRFRLKGGFRDDTRYIETGPEENEYTIVSYDGSRLHYYDGFYKLEVCLRFVESGDWEEIKRGDLQD